MAIERERQPADREDAMSATCEILVDDPDGRIQRLQMPCGKPAVIHYDGRNLCADHADPNVLALRESAQAAVVDADKSSYLAASLAALAPK